MATPIKYDNLYLHSQYGQKSSSDFKKHLLDNNFAHRVLDFEVENMGPCLEALNTWFRDENGNTITFTEMPILTYDEIYWVSDDKSIVASTRKYAVNPEDLPSDFATKVVKNS